MRQDPRLVDLQRRLNTHLSEMHKTRTAWWQTWRELSDYFLPRRYPWLLTDKESRTASTRNTKLLDSTSIIALRTLATGMMNGITSPSRQWFRLRLMGEARDYEPPYEEKIWLEESSRRMHLVMSESNFYNALGIHYIEWCNFGTAALGIYEDYDSIIRAYNYAVGEFYIEVDHTGRVSRFARKFRRSYEQLEQDFGLENLPPNVQTAVKKRDAEGATQATVMHMMQLNREPIPGVPRDARFVEFYWCEGAPLGQFLRMTPAYETPHIVSRWETYGSDTYGSSPTLDALPDVLQLNQLIKRRGQGLDKMVSPPMLANKALQSQEKVLLPGGVTYTTVPDLSQAMRPAFQINIPFQELNLDIEQTRDRIRRVLYNDLFRAISDLGTVRSATEIDARREERLVQLAPVLERFESEGLGPILERIFSICLRSGVFPPPPQSLVDRELSIQYIGLLSDAQRSVGTIPIERYLQLIGNMSSIFPSILELPNEEEIAREYAESIGLKERLQRSREEVAARRQQKEQQGAALEAAQQGALITEGAKTLSETDVGGGRNALNALMGG